MNDREGRGGVKGSGRSVLIARHDDDDDDDEYQYFNFCIQLKGFKYYYSTLIILFIRLHTAKLFQVLLLNSKNSI